MRTSGAVVTRVFDCFTFSTELDLLEFRLRYLSEVVDHFVLVEAPRTFSGLDKPLLFADQQDRFAPWRSRITHVVVDDLPAPEPDRWVPEHFQRNAIVRGLTDAEPDDVVLVTDVDEIPDAAVVGRLAAELDGTTMLAMRTCYLRANWIAPQLWPLSRATRMSRLGRPNDLRLAPTLTQVADAGTHFSYLMDVADIDRKLGWFAHDELDDPMTRSHAYQSAMSSAAVFAGHGMALEVAQPDQLDAVQQALLAERPDFFDFRRRPPGVQQLGLAWWRVRQSSRLDLPPGAVHLGDRTLARLGTAALRATRRPAPDRAPDPT